MTQTKNKTEELVYSAALKKYGRDSASLTVVAPHIFDTYEKGDTLNS